MNYFHLAYIIVAVKLGDSMSKLNRLQKILLAMIVVFLIFGIVLRSIGGNLTSNLAYDGVSMLKYGLIDQPLNTVKNWMKDFSDLWAVKDENDNLKSLISTMPSIQAENDELKRKNAELNEALDLQKDEDKYLLTYAHVKTRDQAYWNNQVVIDKGSKDGIKEGMAVRTNKGLIGKIQSVSTYSSVVKLLTSQDKQNNVAIKISISDKTSVDGILESYDARKGRYVVKLFDASDDIKQGMQVISSGKGGAYPDGIFVGTVDTVQALTNQTGQTVYVTPIDDFQSFSIVSVIGEK